MKKLLIYPVMALVLLGLAGCGEQITVHCDRCGAEIVTREDVTEDWILFCKDCEEEIGPIVE